jgi:hypothetical protein
MTTILMADAQLITQAALKEQLHYDPVTGDFTWRDRDHNSFKGKPIRKKRGQYQRIRINYVGYRAHRLAWLYMTGKWPRIDIDHINGEPSDNRWANLREATASQNLANAKKQKNNVSGIKGVCEEGRYGTWRVTVGGKHIGTYKTMHEAINVRRRIAQEAYGEFARED